MVLTHDPARGLSRNVIVRMKQDVLTREVGRSREKKGKRARGNGQGGEGREWGLKGLGGENVVINCWQQIQGEDYWTVTQWQMSDEYLLTCFLHLGGNVTDEFRPGGLVPPNRRGC